MTRNKEALYRQEIEELTDLVRNDKGWHDLRRILGEAGFNLSRTMLVSFLEDEEEGEYGVLVTLDKKVYEYERSTAAIENDIRHFKFKEITANKEKRALFPQIETALRMIDEGFKCNNILKAMKKRCFDFMRIFSLGLAAIFFVLITGAFLYEILYGGGNHWFFFGTGVDWFIVKYYIWFDLVFVLPLTFPLFKKRSTLNWMMAAGALPLFFNYLYIFNCLSD